ncbi:MAG TPA: hypothetical protein VIM41_03075 [Gammaproteobacteria bacterium]
MNRLTISWETTGAGSVPVMYYVDGVAAGLDNSGFDVVLDQIRARRNVQVVLQIRHMPSLGGDSLINCLPFKDRFEEFRESLGGNQFIYQFE